MGDSRWESRGAKAERDQGQVSDVSTGASLTPELAWIKVLFEALEPFLGYSFSFIKPLAGEYPGLLLTTWMWHKHSQEELVGEHQVLAGLLHPRAAEPRPQPNCVRWRYTLKVYL